MRELYHHPFLRSVVVFLRRLFQNCCTLYQFYSFLAWTFCIALLIALLIMVPRWRRGEGPAIRGGAVASEGNHSFPGSTRRAPRVVPQATPLSQRPLGSSDLQPSDAGQAKHPPPPSERNPSAAPLQSPTLSLLPSQSALVAHDTTSVHDSPTNGTITIGHRNNYFDIFPKELIGEVFLHALPHRDPLTITAKDPQLSLRLVCRCWRDVIDSFPPMWRVLNPALARVGHDDPQRYQFLTWYKDVTGRIQAFDHITLRLPAKPLGQDWIQAIDWELFHHLLALCTKSSAIKMEIPVSHPSASSLLGDPAPNPYPAAYPTPSDGDRLDKLRMVHWVMRDPFSQPLPSSLGLPWNSLSALPWLQLTIVVLCLPMSLQDCVFIFEHAKSIEHAVLRTISQLREEVRYPNNLVVLSHLSYLEIDSEVNLSDLFQRFSMPVLRELKLKLDNTPVPHLLALPWPQLTKVILQCRLTVQALEGIIGNLGSIEEFEWDGVLASDDGWSLNKRLSSLKNFRISPQDKNVGSAMASHFVRHILPSTIEIITIPTMPVIRDQVISLQNFSSLRKVELQQKIDPWGFFLLLSNVQSLHDGHFIIGDGVEESPPPPLSPSSLSPYPSSPVYPLAPSPTPIYPPTRSNLASLYLQLEFQHQEYTERFFQALSLPELSSLTVRTRKRSSSGCYGLIGMLERSRSPVSKLHLLGESLEEERVVRCLQTVSSTLVDFAIDNGLNSQLTGAIFRALTHGLAPPDEGCLCPRLENLDISLLCDGALMSLYGMTQSRCSLDNKCRTCNGSVKKIRSVRAYLRGPEVVWATEWKKQMNEMGICIGLEFSTFH